MFGGMDDEAGTAEDLDMMFDQNYLENDGVVDGQPLGLDGQAKKPAAGISCRVLPIPIGNHKDHLSHGKLHA